MTSGKHNHGYHQNTEKCKRYRAEGRLERNKLKRILKCNGIASALKWAEAHSAVSILRAMRGERS